jgi:hypothetical protein
MGARARSTVSTLTGLALIVVGLLVFAGAYFLLPLFLTTVNCFDVCGPPLTRTMWEDSQHLLANLAFFPVANVLILVLHHLPPLGAVAGVGCTIAYRVSALRAFAIWSRRAWFAGAAALLLILLLSLLGSQPELGYLGMLVGYGVCWVGSRLLLSAQPLSQTA